MFSKKISTFLVAIGLFAFGTVAPANSSDIPTPMPQPPLSQQQLDDLGIVGDPIDIQTDAQGSSFYLYPDSQFIIVPPDTSADARAAGFNFGGCAGNFAGIDLLSGQLYWGAQNSCAASTPNGVYPHIVSVGLRSTCVGFFCGIFGDVRNASSGQQNAFNLVNTVSQFTNCVTSTSYSYQEIVQIEVGGYSAGPFVSPTVTVPCNVNPD